MRSRILIADDHQIFRQGLRNLLEKAGYEIVGEASDGREALRCMKELRPDIGILDLSMPVMNGIDATHEIRRWDGDAKIVLLTMHSNRQYAIQAIKAGVRAYVLKSQAAEDLLTALPAVARSQFYLSPGVTDAVVNFGFLAGNSAERDPISRRERQVLQLIAEGKTSKEVAAILCISPKTADTHRHSMMAKLKIHDVAGLVRYAISHGIIQVDRLAD